MVIDRPSCGALALAVFGLTLIVPATAADAQQQPNRAIEQVKGDVYRFQNNNHFAMFVVTTDGIVVTDPINAEAVDWLKSELASRFNKPVTHMIMSHSHADHASGGQAWGDVAVIAHDNFAGHIEAGQVDTAKPTEAFAETHTMEVGGKTFELTYLGAGHGDDMIATVVRPENVAFIVDVVTPKRLPFRDFGGADIDGYIDQIEAVEGLDFEVLAPGHGAVGTKADAAEARVYIEELRDGVKKALDEGKSVDDIVASDLMSKYADWNAYDQWRALNIEGMARWLQQKG